MPADRAHRDRLGTLAKMQGLRLAREEIALAEARDTLRLKQSDADSARRELLAREREMASLLSDGTFPAHSFRLQGALLAAGQSRMAEADARMEAAALAEMERHGRWNANRHQHEQLCASHCAAARRLARKEDDRAMSEATAFASARPKEGGS